MHLAEAEELANALISQYVPEWKFNFDRAVNRLGCCHYRNKTITLSRHLTAIADRAEIEDTVLHEIAHALTPKDKGHGYEWQLACKAIGCSGKRTHDLPIEYKFIGVCPNGHTVKRNRRNPNVSCTKCSPVYSISYKFV